LIADLLLAISLEKGVLGAGQTILQDVNNAGPEALPVSVFLTLHKS